VDLNGIIDDIEKGNYRFNPEDQKPLRVTNKVSDLWSQPPSDDQPQLHIYIGLPDGATSEYSRLVAPAQDI